MDRTRRHHLPHRPPQLTSTTPDTPSERRGRRAVPGKTKCLPRGEVASTVPAYVAGMTTPANEERPVDLEDVPVEEEDIEPADAADRLEEHPLDQPNRVDPKYAKGEGDPV